MRHVLAAVLLVACSDPEFRATDLHAELDASVDDLAVAVPRDFDEIVSYVFAPICAAGLCHSAASSAGKLDLETDPYKALVGVAAENSTAASRNLARVTPCDPDASFLYIKVNLFQLSANDRMGLGANMPLDGRLLPQAQRLAIRDWILRGAPRVEGASTCLVDGGG